jgi:tRNA pseudouridine38-40 synthase
LPDAALKRIALGVQYDGTAFNGYQKQIDRNTVQDKLEIALEEFGRVFSCRPPAPAAPTPASTRSSRSSISTPNLTRPMQSWVRGVNAFLPDAIAVRWASELPHDPEQEFHARFSARARTYHYVLYNNPVRSPLLVGRAGWTFRPLDVDKMREAAQCLVGTHDFSAFRSSQCQAKSPVKQMHEVKVERIGEAIVFTLRANAFLHHMVPQPDRIAHLRGQRPPPAVLAARRARRARPQRRRAHFHARWPVPGQNRLRSQVGLPQESRAPLAMVLNMHRTRIKICGLTRPEDIPRPSPPAPTRSASCFIRQPALCDAAARRRLISGLAALRQTVGLFVNARPRTRWRRRWRRPRWRCCSSTATRPRHSARPLPPRHAGPSCGCFASSPTQAPPIC